MDAALGVLSKREQWKRIQRPGAPATKNAQLKAMVGESAVEWEVARSAGPMVMDAALGVLSKREQWKRIQRPGAPATKNAQLKAMAGESAVEWEVARSAGPMVMDAALGVLSKREQWKRIQRRGAPATKNAQLKAMVGESAVEWEVARSAGPMVMDAALGVLSKREQ